MKLTIGVAAFAASAAFAAAASATFGQVAFNTYGAQFPQVHQTERHHVSGIPGSPYPRRLGFGFVSDATGEISEVTLALFRMPIATGSVWLEVYADSTVLPGTPGDLLGQFSYLAQVWNPPTIGPGATVNFSEPTIPLVQGQIYYLVAATMPNSDAVWHTLPDPIGSPRANMVMRATGGAWVSEPAPFGAFRITVVPGPGAAAVLVLAGVAAVRRRRE
jgi:hypothetical protein